MILLIDKTKLTNFTAFSKYVELVYIEPYVLTMQFQYVKTFLGDAFYAELLTQKSTNTLTPANENLLYGTANELFLGLQAWLCWLSYKEYLLQANQKSTQTGVRTWNDNNSDLIEAKTQSMLIKDAGEKSDFYKNEVVKFLKDNTASYPLYVDNNCTNNTNNNVFNFGFGVVKR